MSLLSLRRVRDVAATVAALVVGTTAGAAEVYYQPIVSLQTTYNNNVDLDPLHKQGAEGYFADAATNIGIATARSETLLQPRLLYNYYPSIAERNRLEGFLNLSTHYNWERDRFNLTGFYDHRDDVNAEQPPAEQNAVNPDVGNTTPTTGRVSVGTTRDYAILSPTFTHLLTPLSSIGVAGEYQRLTYSPSDTSNHLNFNYYLGRVFYSKTIDLRTDFSIGAYGSRYDSGSIDSHSTSGGVQLKGGYNWSQVLRSDLTLQWQRTKFEETSPRLIDQTSNPWAATLNTVYKAEISSYSFSIGRTIYPSSAGGLYTTDQVRGQYDREVSERLHFMGALRYFRDRTTAGAISGNNTRNYATGTVRLQYMLTRTLFVAGAYTHTYQKYNFESASAQADLVSLAFGYRGLERQQR
jgi:hypothetical protein